MSNQQHYDHQPLLSKTIYVRRRRLAVHFWRSKSELINADLQEFTYISSMRTQDIIWLVVWGLGLYQPL